MWAQALICVVTILLTHPQAHAAKFEKSLGVGIAYYSGNSNNSLTPIISPQFTFSANSLFSKRWNLVNRFNLGFLSGAKFGGQYGSYIGFVGGYELALRLNFGKEVIFPYLELGTLLGMYALTLSNTGNPAISSNQTALKYGYAIGIGFDVCKAGKRGDGPGFGGGFTYFHYMPSPSMFEFSSARQAAAGIAVELRYFFAP